MLRFSVAVVARVAVGVLVAPLIVVGVTAPASASSDGLWYVDALKIRPHHDAGITGQGVKIAVIDGQLNVDVPTLRGADIQVREPSFCFDAAGAPVPATSTAISMLDPTTHGTDVVSMIVGSGEGYPGQSGLVGVAPDATVLYYATAGPTAVEKDDIECLGEDGTPFEPFGRAVQEALDAGADIISISLGVGLGDLVPAMARAYREGVPIVAALPNSSDLEMTAQMPGRSNGAVSVQAAGPTGEIQKTGSLLNTDVDTDVVAPGLEILTQGDPRTGSWETQIVHRGTSLATPMVAGILALVKQKYPEATGNQLIQSLIHNTSGEPDHEPYYDPEYVYGYGLVSVDNLLSVDPAKYPDVNPLIVKAAGGSVEFPSYDEIFNPEIAPDPGTLPDQAAPGDSSGLLLAGVIAGVIGLIVLLLAVTITVVVVRRRSRASRHGTTPTGAGE